MSLRNIKPEEVGQLKVSHQTIKKSIKDYRFENRGFEEALPGDFFLRNSCHPLAINLILP